MPTNADEPNANATSSPDGVAGVTVVLPTHQRPAGLRRVLDGLAAQRDPGVPWEVVVVDNAPPSAAPVFANATVGFPVPIRLVDEPRNGSAHARNRGVAETTTDLVAFVDDDVTPDDDWLATLLEPILDGRCRATGGRVVLDPDTPRPRWLAPWLEGYLADYQPSDDEVDIRELPVSSEFEPFLLTASAAFHRDDVVAAGGFDPELGPRRGEPIVNDDVSLCRRVLARGVTVRYVPSSVVVHELPPERLRRRYIWRRMHAQGRSQWILDREVNRRYRYGGVKGTARWMVRVYPEVALRWGPMIRPLTWIWTDAAYRFGFMREGLRHGLDRRRVERTAR